MWWKHSGCLFGILLLGAVSVQGQANPFQSLQRDQLSTQLPTGSDQPQYDCPDGTPTIDCSSRDQEQWVRYAPQRNTPAVDENYPGSGGQLETGLSRTPRVTTARLPEPAT